MFEVRINETKNERNFFLKLFTDMYVVGEYYCTSLYGELCFFQCYVFFQRFLIFLCVMKTP